MIKVTVVGESTNDVTEITNTVSELLTSIESIRLSITGLAVQAIKEIDTRGSVAKYKLGSIKPSLEKIKQFLNKDTG